LATVGFVFRPNSLDKSESVHNNTDSLRLNFTPPSAGTLDGAARQA
jgi:hypothetical protein